MIPVLVHDNADRPVYLEARQYRDFAVSALYNERLEELIKDIETRSSATLASNYRETRYDTVPNLPGNFAPRSDELEALKQTILSDRDQRDVALVALKGMGGIGKRVLAQALCHDESVQAAFPDGIIWVKIGEKPSDADLINQMREAARALDKSTEGFDTLVGNSNLLRNLLKDKSVLLVLDDVWNARHVSYFRTHGARFCGLLLTTVEDLNGGHRREALGGGRLSRRRYSCPGGRPWVRCKTGVSQVMTGVVLGEPGFAHENEEAETALGLDGEKVFSPAQMIRNRSSFQKRKGHFHGHKRNNFAMNLGVRWTLFASEHLRSRSFLN